MKNLALSLLAGLVLLTGCSTNGSFGNQPTLSTGGAVALGAAGLIGWGLSSFFGSQTQQAAIAATERVEDQRILAYKQLNARCGLGGNGTVGVTGEVAGNITVSGTNSGTANCPTSGLPYPEHGNTSFHQASGGLQSQQSPRQIGYQQSGWQPRWNGLDCTRLPAGSAEYVQCNRAAGLIQ